MIIMERTLELTSIQKIYVDHAREILAVPVANDGMAYARRVGALEVTLEKLLDVIGELTGAEK